MALGPILAHETVLACSGCSNKSFYHSSSLSKLVPHGCNYGYDVLIYVGKAVFLSCRDEKSIQNDLHQCGILISRSEIGYLAKKFIIYLAIAHRQAQQVLVERMSLSGGYILHLDGTSEGGSPHLISALDGLSELVLKNIKVSTESAEQLIPFLKKIQKAYGNPIALVHDMSAPIIKAVSTVFKNIPDFICHFHFLRDIGKDLLGNDNDCIRKSLRKHGVQTFLYNQLRKLKQEAENSEIIVDSVLKAVENNRAIVVDEKVPITLLLYLLFAWALEGKRQGGGYGFPFDKTYLCFFHRLERIYTIINRLNHDTITPVHQRKLLGKTWKKLYDITTDRKLKVAVMRMDKKAVVFDNLRKAMRIALPESKSGLNDEGQKEIALIRKQLTSFRQSFNADKLKQFPEYKNFVAQIDQYWDKLLADPIVKKTPKGTTTIYPQRTNNILEQFFRHFRSDNRRRTGNNSLTRLLKTMLCDTPLAKNLENEEYVSIICGTENSLEDRFAQIDHDIVRQEFKSGVRQNRSLSPKFKKVIALNELPDKITEIISMRQ